MLRAGTACAGVRPGRQPAQGLGRTGQGYDWFENEHGINIDDKGFVWVGGNGNNDVSATGPTIAFRSSARTALS
jgi:hypothetical protein